MTSPLDTGLVFKLVASGGVVDQVSGYPMTGRGSAQAINQVNGESVYDCRGINTGAFINVGGGVGSLVSDQTVVFDMVLAGAHAGTIPAIGGLWRSTTQNDGMLVVDRTGADTVQVTFRIGGATSTKVFTIGASTLYGQRIILAASISRGTTGRSVFLRIAAAGTLLQNQEQAYSASGSADVTPSGNEYISIGSEPVENPSRNPNYYSYAQYHFSRVLSPDEVVTLSNPASGGAGDISGAFASTLAGTTIAAAGQVIAAGALSSTLDGATLAAAGTAGNQPSGSLASTLTGVTMSASGAATNAGALASTLNGASMTASGTVTNRGALASSLDGASLAASGGVATNATGTMSSTLAGAALAAGGYVGIPPEGPDFFIRLPKNPRHSLRH
ncbi:hypothetical protein [Massilia sp. ZL223]|uniref:hypothetical protein n=1 Tax=Massilia sp. ZL223 TaxID=2824904 RepID=UPI001B8157F0|nr:hypothetical protein [Massilia sp. ZL223]MBQ5963149.1 hypothetical protein [Massilia sp. ZL223]